MSLRDEPIQDGGGNGGLVEVPVLIGYGKLGGDDGGSGVAYFTLPDPRANEFSKFRPLQQAQGPELQLPYRHKFAYGEFMTAETDDPSVAELVEAIVIDSMR